MLRGRGLTLLAGALSLTAACGAGRPAPAGDASAAAAVPPTTATTTITTVAKAAAGHLYVIDVAAGRVADVTADPALLDLPQWAPDGAGIRYATGNRAVAAKADGTAAGPVALPPLTRTPVWSAAGQAAALVAGDDLAVAQPSGAVRRITAKAVGPVSGWAWSPDGRRLAVVAGGRVWAAAADTSGVTALTPPGKAWRFVAWSPDGRRLAYYESGRVKLIDADGSHPVDLAPANADPSFSWSPDGTRLVVAAPKAGAYAMTIVPVDGGPATRLWVDGVEVAWSPDGRTIAFRAAPLQEGIEVINPDGSNRRTLVVPGANVVFARGLAWSPDGTRLLVGTGTDGPGGPPEPPHE